MPVRLGASWRAAASGVTIGDRFRHATHFMFLRLRSACLVALLAAVLSGCAAYSGDTLVPGVSVEADVRALMGEPAMRWQRSGRGVQLAYPRGPAGFHTFMVFLDTGGRLERIVNVLDEEYFGSVRPGMGQAEILQLLGPPQPQWTEYFAARDELVWEWRYCDSWSEAARFDVLFDGQTKTVRSTLRRSEGLMVDRRISCGR